MAVVRHRVYRDHLGGEYPHDGIAPVAWRVSAYVVAVRDGKVLMTEPTFAPGRWDLPGGGVYAGEGIVDGAARECWEETGHRFSAPTPAVIRFLGEDRFYMDPGVEPATSPFRHSLLFAVEGTAALGADPAWPGAPDECRRVEWVDPRELSPENTHPNHWRALRMAGLVRTSGAVTVVRAVAEDADRVFAVTRAANFEYAGRWALSALEESVSDVARDLAEGTGFVASVGTECVGAIRCLVLGDASGFIQRLAVVPAWRRRGVATLLMQAAERHLAESGVRRCALETVAENDGVTAFYRGLGYRITNTKPVPRRGVTQHDWDKALGSGGV